MDTNLALILKQACDLVNMTYNTLYVCKPNRPNVSSDWNKYSQPIFMSLMVESIYFEVGADNHVVVHTVRESDIVDAWQEYKIKGKDRPDYLAGIDKSIDEQLYRNKD